MIRFRNLIKFAAMAALITGCSSDSNNSNSEETGTDASSSSIGATMSSSSTGTATSSSSGTITPPAGNSNLIIDGKEFKYKGQKIFFSGMNLAWIDYNSDVGASPLDENKWRKAVQDIRAAGGNAIRWWLFNNMSTSPNINTSTNLVSGLPANTISNMKKALDIAEEYGVMVSMCLFSHNLMEDDNWGNYNEKIPIEANRKLFTDEGIEAFINNALKPVIEGVGLHNALWTWELFNEPEGMAANIPNASWTKSKIPMADIQKFSNRVASAIHEYNSALLVSNGIHNTDAFQYWTDAALRSAGGKDNGVLDFYQIHFYPEHQTSSQNPFDHPASHWGLDKPLVIGEFSAAGWNKEQFPAYKVSTKTPQQLYLWAYEQGYAGALSWDYGGFNDNVAGNAVTHNYAAAKPGMEALAAQYEQYIEIKDYTPQNTSGNGVMQVTYSNVQSEATLEYQKTFNLTGNPAITFKVRTVGNASAFSLRLVVKSGSSWTWSDTNKMCDITAGGAWTTCSYNLSSDFSDVALSDVRSFLIQTFSNGYSGVIQFDDFVAGTTVINNFDTQFDVFGVAANMDGGDAITKIETVYLQ
uniref:Mannanase galactose-binding domain-containing protein n=1 Tax=uncultured bacterium contig00069 TaxID=1181550 RepID=A0A806K0D9_9BACT|nr:hypothetical protein [uncultured bacterium contig00069]